VRNPVTGRLELNLGYAAAGKPAQGTIQQKSAVSAYCTAQVSDFNNRYPSSVKLEVVALINGVDKGGTIPAGPAKQVVGGIPPQK
jgi:hypothetical protein